MLQAFERLGKVHIICDRLPAILQTKQTGVRSPQGSAHAAPMSVCTRCTHSQAATKFSSSHAAVLHTWTSWATLLLLLS